MPDTEQAKEKAQQAAQQASQQAKGRLREQVDQRSTQAGQQINSTVEDVRSVAHELRTQGKDTPARYAEQAADKAQQLGNRLEHASGDELLGDVEDFARRNPWAVAAGGLLLGLAASRMLKASSSERYRSSIEKQTRPHTLAAEPMPSGAATAGARFERDSADLGNGEPAPALATEPRS